MKFALHKENVRGDRSMKHRAPGEIMKYIRATWTYLSLIVLSALSLSGHAADLAGHKTVSLVTQAGDKVVIGHVDLSPKNGGYEFNLAFKKEAFRETYMQETYFLCLPDARREICHFPFPPGDYAPDDSSGFFTASDLKGLEHALLFTHKRPAPADVDVTLFNGMYYRLTVVGNRIEGTVFGVDFNRLVVTDEKEKYPLKPDDLDSVDLRAERFPHLVIE
jgi:hypothetical protein